MRAYLDNGGSIGDLDKLKQSALCSDFLGQHLFGEEVADPLGYLAGVAKNVQGEIIELTSEVLADAIKLVHPDCHPPEREALARRVTQSLLALQPFTFPAPKPEPPAPPEAARNGSIKAPRERSKEPLRRDAYPCADCRNTVPHFYCDPCRSKWDEGRAKEREREAAKRRKWYERRKAARLARKPLTICAACGVKFKGKRADARFCSDACRQKAHRQAAVSHARSNSCCGAKG